MPESTICRWLRDEEKLQDVVVMDQSTDWMKKGQNYAQDQQHNKLVFICL